MTCIAGLVDKDGTVYVGGDSAGVRTSSWELVVRADRKVFTLGDLVLGFTSSFRMGQVLRYELKVPPLPADWDDAEAWMVTALIPAVRECLKAAGWAARDKDREEGGEFLIGVRGRLFAVHSDYQVAEALDGIQAVGSGAALAVGALWALRDAPFPGEEKVQVALQAAERFNAAVRGPFVVRSARKA